MSVLELEVWDSPAAEDGLGEHQHVLGSAFVLAHRKRLKLAHAQTLLLKESLGLTGFPVCYCRARKYKRILAQLRMLDIGAGGGWGQAGLRGGAARCPVLQQCRAGFQGLI